MMALGGLALGGCASGGGDGDGTGGDAGPADSGTGESDAGIDLGSEDVDAGPEEDAGTPPDGGAMPDGGNTPRPPTSVVQTAGGGVLVSPTHRLRISVGAPQPIGSRSNDTHQLRVGPQSQPE